MKQNHYLLLSMAAILGLSGCNDTQKHDNSVSVNKPLQVIELVDAQTQSAKQFSGVVRSQETASLAFRIPGTIEQILVKKGDFVQQRQVIARLDPHDYQIVLDELEAKKLEAESVHKLANSELKRVRQATADDAIANVNLDRAISGYERSLSAVKVVNKNIQRAKDTLSYTELRAPFSGVIGSVLFEQHEQVLPGVAVATLKDDGLLEVEIDVPENLIEHFKVGNQATVTWYQADTQINVNVAEVSPVPHLIKQTYSVTYHLEKGDYPLFTGKAVSVVSPLGAAEGAYCLPYSALVGEQGALRINVVRQQKVVTTPVEVAVLEANRACVKGEIQRGEYVVVSGSHYLTDGDSAENLIVRVQ